jgi:hypothetical protein
MMLARCLISARRERGTGWKMAAVGQSMPALFNIGKAGGVKEAF